MKQNRLIDWTSHFSIHLHSILSGPTCSCFQLHYLTRAKNNCLKKNLYTSRYHCFHHDWQPPKAQPLWLAGAGRENGFQPYNRAEILRKMSPSYLNSKEKAKGATSNKSYTAKVSHHSELLLITYIFLNSYLFIYLLAYHLREREGANEWGEGRETEEERENLTHALSSMQSLRQGCIPQTWDHVLSQQWVGHSAE